MSKKIILFSIALAVMFGMATQVEAKKRLKMTNYLFAYFIGNAPQEEQIHFAVSNDGFNYTPLNGGNPVIGSDSIALTKAVRDPHILRGEDGSYFMVVTDMRSSLGWSSNRGIVLLHSKDLVHWTHRTVHFPEKYKGTHFAHVTRVWAPQTIYDKSVGKYMVYFSLLTDDGSIPYDRVYYCYANADFTDLEGEPQVLFDYKQPAIDTDIVQDEQGMFHLFFKTEGGSHKGIRQYTFTNLHKPDTWTLHPGYCEVTKNAVEGAGVFPLIQGGWCLMYDCYMNGHYQFAKSTDNLKTFTFVQDTQTKGKFTPRHGTTIQITGKEYKRLLKAFPIEK